MYVSQLDRPWLETPFLFQGFVIKSEEEIEELKRYCKIVYVQDKDAKPKGESTRGASPPAAVKERPNGLVGRVTGWFKKAPEPEPETVLEATLRPGEFYADTVDVEGELPRAKESFERASQTFRHTMEKIRTGGKLDVRTLEAVVDPMIDSLLRNRDAMTWLSRMRQTDDYTYNHSVSCSIYAIAFGRHLGLPKQDLEILGLGGLLLDVGKTRIPRELLVKQAKLSKDEMQLMRDHVRHSVAIVGEQPDLDPRVLSMVRSHHERYNGSGYPDGLKGPDIHVFARIAGIVDFYDAVITPRAYAPAVSTFDAMRELNKRANTEFQAEMVEQFIQAVGIFPNGALVELSSGEVGVVIEQNRVRRLRPCVMVILDRDKEPRAQPRIIDLREFPSDPGDQDAIWIDRGLEIGAYGINPADYYL